MPSSKWPESEAALAAAFRKWPGLEDWDHFPEVEMEKGKPIADLVCIRGRFAAVFECKTSLSKRVMRQAFWWKDYADKVSIVVPAPANQRQLEEREKELPMLQALGLGLIQVKELRADTYETTMILEAERQKQGQSERLMHLCRPEHDELGVAGGQGSGQRYTKFNLTIRNLQWYVLDNPGCAVKEAVRNIEHHWQTDSLARQRLQAMAREGKLQGIVAEEKGGLQELTLDDETREQLLALRTDEEAATQ